MPNPVLQPSCITIFEMATSSSEVTPTVAVPAAAIPTAIPTLPSPNLNFHEKLEGPNYIGWLTQFLPILRSTDSMGIIDGSEPCPPKFLADNSDTPNPEFALWQRRDQTILSWINITLSKKVLSSIYGLDTSRQVWLALANQFANQSKTRIANLKKKLQSLHQGSKSCSEYIQAAKEYSDQLAAAGKPIPDEDLITYLTNGLNPSFNSFITSFSIMTRDKDLSLDDFQEELLNHETLLNHQQTKAVDTSTFALFNHKPHTRNFSPKTRGSTFIPETLALALKQQHRLPLRGTIHFHHLPGTLHLLDTLVLQGILLIALSLHRNLGFLSLPTLGHLVKYVASLVTKRLTAII
jgi:hypothetical protein